MGHLSSWVAQKWSKALELRALWELCLTPDCPITKWGAKSGSGHPSAAQCCCIQNGLQIGQTQTAHRLLGSGSLRWHGGCWQAGMGSCCTAVHWVARMAPPLETKEQTFVFQSVHLRNCCANSDVLGECGSLDNSRGHGVPSDCSYT